VKSFFDCVSIVAVAATVPPFSQELNEEFLGISLEDIQKISKITGILKVARASKSVTASDLCINSARLIFESNPNLVNEIDAIIFVSQSRDFIMPSTSSIIQDSLKLSSNCLCLDIPSGCTGYLHGLFISSSLIASKSCRKVLLLCGETNSKLINEKDKSVSMIFGDAGSATVLGLRSNSDSFFSFRTDGTGHQNIIIQDGGCRNGFNVNSLNLVEYENGNLRHSLNMKMDGMSVFNFAITAVPSLVRESLLDCSLSPDGVDLFAVHQANQLIVNQIAKKCGFSNKQTPFLASNFGNTGPASIPLLLSEGFSEQSSKLKKVVLCGFGVGLNWGVCVADLSNTKIHPTSYFV
jgi:3-oxoacyl-[acyl-carrier-protein] synthase III